MSIRQVQTAFIPQRTVLLSGAGDTVLPGGTIGFVVEGAGSLDLTYSDGSTDSVPVAGGQQLALAAVSINLTTSTATGIHAFLA